VLRLGGALSLLFLIVVFGENFSNDDSGRTGSEDFGYFRFNDK
jgi:hypothetical protein